MKSRIRDDNEEVTFLLWAKKDDKALRTLESLAGIERISPSLVRVSCKGETAERTRQVAEEVEEMLIGSRLQWAEE